jgi:ElaA protein
VAQVPPRRIAARSYRGRVIRSAALDAMSPRDLYDVLALRVAVFVVEQECAYLELDGRDTEPSVVHWWSRDDDGALLAALRVLVEPGGGHRIGRVVSAPAARGTGAGAALMRAALATLPGPVVLGAQVRVRGFYERLGFAVDGPEYDEDGIGHVPMLRPSTGTLQEGGGSSTVCSPSC